MNAQEIDAIVDMPEGEWRVWLASRFEAIDVRFAGMERKRWPWALAGGGVGTVGALMGVAVKLLS